MKSAVYALMAGLLTGSPAMAQPLKVYILAGQSNMQGHAEVRTFPHIGMDPETAPLLKTMTLEDGTPRVCEEVYISYLTATGGWGKTPTPLEKQGALTAGFGAQGRAPKIGPEFTFGLYMHKLLNEPILLIKTAWGGKSLNTDFRPPSAGPYTWPEDIAAGLSEEKREKKKAATGRYYRMMMEHVNKVLADPGAYHPAYDKNKGYEIAGFVWFQGFNDMVDSHAYPNRTQPGGYDLYTELMSAFIRDVRKDLKAPDMPFVIGVLGVGGVPTEATEAAKPPRYRGIAPGIRKAMAAPAGMPEFKGTVAAVHTGRYWDTELDELDQRMGREVSSKMKAAEKERQMTREEKAALKEKLTKAAFTERELEILTTGKSNQGYHYLGSSKILGQIGKAFAEAMAGLQAR